MKERWTGVGEKFVTFYLTHSQYTDTGPTSPSADPIMPPTPKWLKDAV